MTSCRRLGEIGRSEDISTLAHVASVLLQRRSDITKMEIRLTTVQRTSLSSVVDVTWPETVASLWRPKTCGDGEQRRKRKRHDLHHLRSEVHV
ncbi:MAG: hypothetical protein J2P31_13285 [Blastocatellia bacterium]|nr:hypothetical protein [Blastocatellia bacterium]